MRIIRIDEIAPGGRTLELHPQLTVLRGAPPELRRRLESVVRMVAGRGDATFGGEIEVNGVRLALDPATLARLEIEVRRDPVLVLGDLAPVTESRPADLRTAMPPPPPPASDVHTAAGSLWENPLPAVDPNERVEQLREELRDLGAQRQQLEEQMRAVRERLDPGAPTALEVIRGRIDALDLRRTAARSAWEAHQASVRGQRNELTERLGELEERIEAIGQLDPESIAAAAAELRSASETQSAVDPTSLEIAAQLESAVERLLEARRRREDLERRHADLLAQLQEAERRAQEAGQAVRSHGDAETVRRLEEVRDEIFAAADKGSRLSSRGRRRLQELRAEQAVLLEQLGFDTYSAYVMGIPSVRSEMERSSRVEVANERVDALRGALDELGVAMAGREGTERLEGELQTLLVLAHRELGPDDLLAMPLDVGRPDVEDLVASTVAALRSPRPGSGDSQRVSACRATLCQRIEHFVPTSRIVAPEASDCPPPPTAGVGTEQLLALAERWTDWLTQRRADTGALRSECAAIQDELAALGDESAAPWADIEAEMDQELDLLTETEDRARGHDAATEELAQLRDEELALRARERDLLGQVAAAGDVPTPPPFVSDAGLFTSPPDPSLPADEELAADASGAAPPPRVIDLSDAEEWSSAWEVSSSLARFYQVSFAGSVPVLVVVGAQGVPQQVRSVIQRLSGLIQLVVLTDDVELVDWARSLGDGARPVEFATRVD